MTHFLSFHVQFWTFDTYKYWCEIQSCIEDKKKGSSILPIIAKQVIISKAAPAVHVGPAPQKDDVG